MKNLLNILWCCSVFILCTTSSLKAERFIVTNTNSSGAGSLMQAVQDANALAGQDTILFSTNVRGTIYNTGVLQLTDGLVMIGPGPDLLAISANQNGRVVYINYCYGKNFLFQGLTFKNGRSTSGGGAGICGVGDTVRIINCIIKDNESVYQNSGGGGIAVFTTGVLYIENCLILNNQSYVGGSGITLGSEVTAYIKNTSICNNSTSGNAVYGGGGVYNAGKLNMYNCTVSGNSHPTRGGGIYVWGFLNMSNCTVSDNYANNCGGIFDTSAALVDSVIILSNTIVAGNTSNTSSKDVFGRIYSRGYNLIQNKAAATIFGDETGNIYNQDPLLGSLQNYSSTVMAHPLLTGSPAIDNGNNLTCLPIDQRGIERPQDGNGDGNNVADIGSIEMMVDNDSDGISDTEEKGPNGNDPTYDGNNDGTPDWNQSNVTSFWNYNDEHYLTLAVPSSYNLIDVRAIDNPSPGNAPNLEFPVGFFSFIIDLQGMTGSVVVRMYLPQGAVITDYCKYGQTPVLPLPHWYQFMYDSQTGAEITQPNIVDLHFIDGERGDNDITVNGYIVEPGGPVGFVSDVDDEITLPFTFKLEQNYPNPFNPSTRIEYQVPSISQVTLKIYDVLGNEVATLVNEEKPSGSYEVEFNANSHSGNVRNLASGIYFYQLKAGELIQTKKMILLK
ncbi:MAG TPA: choice-of-anchor Q domain-containing protein [Ignavibacteriaceae bacterium]|nr:choice-of-anchor Q domain-containing protein [Ignavibacteriaceae bacterium]